MLGSYVVVGSKPWNERVYRERIVQLPGEWHFVSSKDELTETALAEIEPRYVFFLHWSHKVPEDIISKYECICFHMTDVPYGRGGSPLQNLIVRGHRRTKLTALRMVKAFDAGPVYTKRDLSLEGSSAEEIFIRASYLSAKIIAWMVQEERKPVAQQGKPMVFRRRKPKESQIGSHSDLLSLHDFIRMLDADGYLNAFLEHNGFRWSLSRSTLYDGRIVAEVTITQQGDDV